MTINDMETLLLRIEIEIIRNPTDQRLTCANTKRCIKINEYCAFWFVKGVLPNKLYGEIKFHPLIYSFERTKKVRGNTHDNMTEKRGKTANQIRQVSLQRNQHKTKRISVNKLK